MTRSATPVTGGRNQRKSGSAAKVNLMSESVTQTCGNCKWFTPPEWVFLKGDCEWPAPPLPISIPKRYYVEAKWADCPVWEPKP